MVQYSSMLMLMIQAFQRADGLCQPLEVGLNTRVSHLPRVCRHHAAPPPPSPPRGGGLSLVMSRDDDPKDESHDAMKLVETQGLQNQPVGGSPFAQQQWLGSIIQVFGFLVLAVILHDGMLNVGKGKSVLVPWGKQKDTPQIEVSFPQLPVSALYRSSAAPRVSPRVPGSSSTPAAWFLPRLPGCVRPREWACADCAIGHTSGSAR